MSIDPTERVRLGATGVRVSRLGLGSAEIGGLFAAVTDEAAAALIEHAWAAGVRYFDTAPLYGYGNAERRLGRTLAAHPRDEFTLSTKVGRLVVPTDRIGDDMEVDRQAHDGREDAFYAGTPDARVVFDYSRDGIMRSVEDSLSRTGLERIDVLYIHDPDDHWRVAIDEAFPALADLRAQGAVGAIGAGMNQAEMLARFAREGEFDVFMLAGRYTLLDQSALPELLPLCQRKGISVVAVGVMNSGILADPRPGARFDYVEAPAELIERARRMRVVCERHGVSLKTAAIQFPLAHPVVAAVAAGVRTVEHFDDYPRAMATDIPGELWQELRQEGLIADDAPTPP